MGEAIIVRVGRLLIGKAGDSQTVAEEVMRRKL